jgi:hypothetical protein
MSPGLSGAQKQSVIGSINKSLFAYKQYFNDYLGLPRQAISCVKGKPALPKTPRFVPIWQPADGNVDGSRLKWGWHKTQHLLRFAQNNSEKCRSGPGQGDFH